MLMAAKKSTSKQSKSKGKGKVEKVMHEFKHHELRSESGRKVTNPKQAIAIGLSEAREAGAKIPKKGAARKKQAARKTAARKAPSKARKNTSRTSARKRTARKS